ncbi:MAG TPA: cupredoxin domain-containing protein [Candidatus Eisenbacteria bacterium]
MKRLALLAILVALLGSAVALFVARRPARGPGPVRTVVLHMSGYAFNGTNPTLSFRPGERVRFLLRNEETTPIVHDFRIVGFDAPAESAIAPGETRAVAVTMPGAGRYAYTCATHRGMGGAIVVTEGAPPGP